MEQDVKTYKNAVLTNRPPVAGEMQSFENENIINTMQFFDINRQPMAGERWKTLTTVETN